MGVLRYFYATAKKSVSGPGASGYTCPKENRA